MLCCKTMGVEALQKPPHRWCTHCVKGFGCDIYETRPDTCRAFECAWLQVPASILDDRFRPDRAGCVLQYTDNGSGLVAHCDPATPTSWRKPLILDKLRQCAAKGGNASARAGNRYWVITAVTEWEVPSEYIEHGPAPGDIQVFIPDDVAARIGLPVHPRSTVATSRALPD